MKKGCKFATSNQLKHTTMENTIKMQNTFTVKIYNPMISAWMIAASLGFVPEQYMAEKIANQFCEYTFSMYDKIRVCNGNKVLSEYKYE